MLPRYEEDGVLGSGKDASDRFEKSMEIARKKAEADVSSLLAKDSGLTDKSEISN